MAVVNGTGFMKRDTAGAMTADPTDPFSTEIIPNGSTVDWLYLNLTVDSHPFHTHLAHFEVISRQTFNAAAYEQALIATRGAAPAPTPVPASYDPANYPDPAVAGAPLGPVVPAPAQEKGPKDTVIANPGEITRIRLKWDLPTGATTPARFVFHCHILEHEENEMMRPILIT
jgi:spore coat protein A